MREKAPREQERPYRILGVHLKRIREKKQESLAEVSGAVEIDVSSLTAIEHGLERPSEDILMLLVNHFALSDEEVIRLWGLAGYDSLASENPNSPEQDTTKHVMVLPMDARIIYTDMAHVMINDRGVVMNFMQEAGLGGQPLAVARIGMSREHAANVMELLKKALEDQKPKQLPPPKAQDIDTDSKKSA